MPNNDQDPFRPLPIKNMEATNLDKGFLMDLALKVVYADPQCTTERVAETMKLPMSVIDSLLYELYHENMIENRGQLNFGNNRYTLLEHGWQRAQKLMTLNGYIGPAPVRLQEYNTMIEQQSQAESQVTPEAVKQALSHIVLSDDAIQILGLVASSRRSLFLTGPAGNGKTTVAAALHNALHGNIWIPYAIEIDGQIIKVFDQYIHHPVDQAESREYFDERWIKIKRPMVIVGGEMTIETMDLMYSESVNFYEAPFQMKSNCGTLLIDDFGRQRVDPSDMLNRWITPLEGKIDYLTLHTGKKISVPFEQMLIFATNLQPEDLVDDAFLRRMGYRLLIQPPSKATYGKIFRMFCQKNDIKFNDRSLDFLFKLYEAEGKILRGCEPRDLLLRCQDICKYEGRSNELTNELLLNAWKSYFGKAPDSSLLQSKPNVLQRLAEARSNPEVDPPAS